LVVVISPLEQHPDHCVQVAQWHHLESLRQGLNSTLQQRQQRLAAHVQLAPLPKTLIVRQGEQLVGCVSLVSYQYRAQTLSLMAQDTSVWLSNLFVQEPWRQQGIGSLLVEAAKHYARNIGLTELWLSATDYTEFYQRRGWQLDRRTRLAGRIVNVMRVPLTP